MGSLLTVLLKATKIHFEGFSLSEDSRLSRTALDRGNLSPGLRK